MGAISKPERIINFIVGPTGFVSPVPTGAIGPYPTESPGMQFVQGRGGHDFDERTTSVRVMDANHNQGMRTVYENARSQPVHPFSGRTVGRDDPAAHYYHSVVDAYHGTRGR